MNTDTEAETAARELLHTAAERVHGRADLFDRVQAEIRGRRRRRRLAAAGTLAVLAAASVLGVGAGVLSVLPGSSATASSAASGAAPPLSCPSAGPTAAGLRSTQSGVSGYLVPGSPVAGIVCTFTVRAAADGAPSATLTDTRRLSGPRLADVASALQQPVSQYAFSCPAQSQSEELYLDFRYAQGPDVAVLVSLGCPNLTNGTLAGTFDPEGSLPPALETLLPATG